MPVSHNWDATFTNPADLAGEIAIICPIIAISDIKAIFEEKPYIVVIFQLKNNQFDKGV